MAATGGLLYEEIENEGVFITVPSCLTRTVPIKRVGTIGRDA